MYLIIHAIETVEERKARKVRRKLIVKISERRHLEPATGQGESALEQTPFEAFFVKDQD